MTLPDLPDSFRWPREPWGDALRCRPLEAVAPHLFSTRQLALPAFAGPSARQGQTGGWAALGQSLGVDERHVRRIKQVHGNVVVIERDGDAPGGHPEADAQV